MGEVLGRRQDDHLKGIPQHHDHHDETRNATVYLTPTTRYCPPENGRLTAHEGGTPYKLRLRSSNMQRAGSLSAW
jgi:hypothetical protein